MNNRHREKISKAYMPLYVGDYLADTGHLSTEQHGAYMLIIMHLWQTGKPIPEHHLPMITRMGDYWNNARDSIAVLCDISDDKKWTQKRVISELKEYEKKIDLRVKAGKASGKARCKGTQVEHVLQSCCDSVRTKREQKGNIQIQIQNQTSEADDISPQIAPTGADTAKKKIAFKAPDPEQAQAYASEIGLDKNECDVYLDHYATNGWRTKTGPVKDWKAAMRNWKRRAAEFKPQRNFAPSASVKISSNTNAPLRINGQTLSEIEAATKAAREGK
jgi:uncharacterized protein YdaU (DUF1376 family)